MILATRFHFIVEELKKKELKTKWRPCRCYERLEPDTGQFSLTCLSLACVAWRFCRAGRTNGEARETERRGREKNKTLFQVLPPQSPRGFSALAYATQASLS